MHLSLQGAQAFQDDGRVEGGGGAQRVAAECGGLLQVAGVEMGDGETGLGHTPGADPPGRAATQRHGAEREGLLDITDTAETRPRSAPNPLTV